METLLPSNLLVARKHGDTIRPVYANLDRKNLDVAERLIHAYREHVGSKKGDVEVEVGRMEGTGYDYRYVRGLATLLERRCEFRAETAVESLQARRTVFQLAAERGVPATEQDRRAILTAAADALDVTGAQLEHSLYGDLEDEQILRRFESLEAERLVRQYNLSLTQTLLFKSTEMQFTASGNWQRIFRQIKWLGLIYTIHRQGDQYRVQVDGPVSLFKLNHRYGTSLAKLLPHIVVNPEWSVRAKVLQRKGDRKLLNLHLDSGTHGAHLEPPQPAVQGHYDSLVEEDFAHRFEALDTGWKLTREPEPLTVGKRVMIPDFSFQKGGIWVYMEVAGFWTPEYLRHKLRQLKQVEGVDMIVAADRRLACQTLDRMSGKLDVLYYQRRVPLKPVLRHLRRREARLVDRQVEQLKQAALKVEGAVVTTQQLAAKLGVVEEAVKRLLRERPFPGYRRLGDMLIKPSTLQRIAQQLEQRTSRAPLTLHDATRLIQNLGGRRCTAILEALGYTVRWQGINPQEAIIQRKT